MTSQSEPGRVEQQVIENLDEINQAMPEYVTDEIAMARRNALSRARAAKRASVPANSVLKTFALQWRLPLVAPVAVAVLLSVLVSYDPQSEIPVLPANLLAEDVPAEDLAMLEDLEFASWLAEQEDEVVL